MANCETHGHLWQACKCERCGEHIGASSDPVEIPLRDQCAMAAMQGDWAAQTAESGWYSNENVDRWKQTMAQRYYAMADAMLAARKLDSNGN